MIRTSSFQMQVLYASVDGVEVTNIEDVGDKRYVTFSWDSENINAQNGIDWWTTMKAEGYLDSKKWTSKEWYLMKSVFKDKTDSYYRKKYRR